MPQAEQQPVLNVGEKWRTEKRFVSLDPGQGNKDAGQGDEYGAGDENGP